MEFWVITIFFLSILGILFRFEWKKMTGEIEYLTINSKIDKNNSEVLTRLIQNLFLKNDLNLKDLSQLSRQFFDKDDLIKFGWGKTSLYSIDSFFNEEEDGPTQILIPKKESGVNKDLKTKEFERQISKLNKLEISNWDESGKEENQWLMEARRDFFIKNFPAKINILLDRYQIQSNLSNEELMSIFIKRFSALIK